MRGDHVQTLGCVSAMAHARGRRPIPGTRTCLSSRSLEAGSRRARALAALLESGTSANLTMRTWAAQSVTLALRASSQQTSLSEVSALTNVLQVCRSGQTAHNDEHSCSEETCSCRWVHLLPLLLFLTQDSLFNRHVPEYHVALRLQLTGSCPLPRES